MSVIKKPDLKIFAQDAKTGEIETFPNVLRGWGITLERTAGKPPLEWFNAIGKRVDEWLMYLTQRGLAEWDSTVDYPKDALVQHSSVFYVALKVTKGEQPNTSQSAWKPLADFLGVNNKLDKAAVVQSTGTSTTSVMSQKASTDAFQSKGNYADKSSNAIQLFSGGVRTPYIDAVQGDLYVGLRAFNGVPSIYASNIGVGYNIYIPLRNGELALAGDSYTKLESDTRYQPKGNYATKGESYTRAESDNKYQPKGSYQPSGNYALVGASYTKVESDTRYQVKGNYQASGYSYSKLESDNKFQKIGNYADKETTAIQEFSGPVRAKYIDAVSGENYTGLRSSSLLNSIYAKFNGIGYNYELPKKQGVIALTSDIENSELVPHPIPWSLPTAPSGYLICQGQTFNKTTYPKLATAYPSGKLPDMRSNVIRGLDAGRGVDVGRTILAEQMGNSLLSSPIVNEYEKKGFELKIENIGTSGTDNQGWYNLFQQIEGVNGNETRMRNIAFLYIVRAA